MATFPSFDQLNTFILFVGYPRSGHSLVGALLDAHPNAIVSHELDAIGQLRQGMGQMELYRAIVERSSAFAASGSKWMGYSYQIAEGAQGQSRRLTHIGDKRGGTTSKHLETSWEELRQISSWGLRLKIIHVTRNPFDCISTAIKKREAKQNKQFEKNDVQRKIGQFFKKAEVIQALLNSQEFDVHTMRHEALLQDFMPTMRALLAFLDLPSDSAYLAACEAKVWKSAHQSRLESPHWTPAHQQLVLDQIACYSFFKDYSFTS